MVFSEDERASIAFYEEHYVIIRNLPLVAEKPIRLTDHATPAGRCCRFCGRGISEAKFRNTAHAVPAFLGNRSLLSMNECDACNEQLGHDFEDHLAKWFGPLRAISQIRGKNGIPTYKTDGIRIGMQPQGPHILLKKNDGGLKQLLSNGGPVDVTLPVETPTEAHVPLRAAMALVKIACSVCPPPELPQVQGAIDWLMGRLQRTWSGLPILFAFTPGPNPYVTGNVLLLRRATDIAAPYMWCIVATGNYRFQFFIPFCPQDEWIVHDEKTTFTCRHFPTPFGDEWPCGKTQYSVFDWSGSDPVIRDQPVTFHFDRAKESPSSQGDGAREQP